MIVFSDTMLRSQTNLSNNAVNRNQSLNAVLPPLSWELTFGGSFLTNTLLSKNEPFANPNNLSGAFYSYYDIVILKNKVQNLSLRPGLGCNIQTFGLNKIIQNNSNNSEFVDFGSNQNYKYSYLQQIFIDMPLGVVYNFLPRNKKKQCEFTIGAIIGYMIYKEKKYVLKNSSVMDNDIKNLNSFRYGLFGKVSTGKKRFGLSYSLSGQYYLNDLFLSKNNTPTRNFSIMFGISFSLNMDSKK